MPILESRLLRRTTLVLAPVVALLHLVVWLPNHWARQDTDRATVVYWTAARHALEGSALYAPKPDYNPVEAWGGRPFANGGASKWFLYPPPFAALIAPLGRVSYVTFSRLSYLVILAAVWVYAWSLAALATSSKRPPARAVLVAGLCITLFPGAIATASVGQVDPVLWALFGLALQGHAPGALLAAVSVVKPFALWPLALAIRAEGWRVARPALAVLALMTALGLVVCGPASYTGWWRHVVPMLSQGSFDSANVSIPMATLRLVRVLGWAFQDPRPLATGVRNYLMLWSLGGPMAVAWYTRRLPSSLRYAWVTCAAVLCSPYCLFFYLPLLMAPVALLCGAAVARHQPAAADPTGRAETLDRGPGLASQMPRTGRYDES